MGRRGTGGASWGRVAMEGHGAGITYLTCVRGRLVCPILPSSSSSEGGTMVLIRCLRWGWSRVPLEEGGERRGREEGDGGIN